MTSSSWQTALLTLSLALGGSGAWLGLANSGRAPPELCGSQSSPMRRIELAFGMSKGGGTPVSEAAWRDFLDREVTPRFPDGLTVLAGSGQWRDPAGATVKEPSRLLLIWAKPAPDLDHRISLVREGWKRAHDQQSVLRADGMNCVSF